MPRPYTLRRRAEGVEETRRRITEAAAELHGTLGPARTTISAVAERAGVQRLTVYRHFPDETALFQACSAHWIRENPPPDIAAWRTTAAPEARFGRALREMYAYYGRTAGMWSRVYRDLADVPALSKAAERWHAYLDEAVATLAAGWRLRGARRRRLTAVLGHALDFTTWASLDARGVPAADAVPLMRAMARAAAGLGPR